MEDRYFQEVVGGVEESPDGYPVQDVGTVMALGLI
jgi:hypothetical protein